MWNYFIVASLLTLCTHGYLALRLLPGVRRGTAAWRGILALLVANVLLLPGTLVLTLRAPARCAVWAVPLAHLAFADVGFSILLFCGLLLRDLGWGALWLLTLRPFRGAGGAVDKSERRRVLLHGLNLAVAALAGTATAVGYGLALAQPVVRRVRIPCQRAPQAWSERGLTIVQLSDLHIGPTIRSGYLQKLVDTVNSLAADVVVITGDLVDGFVMQLREQLEPLRSLRSRHGVYVVTGNHEYFYRAPEWVAALRELGLRVLTDEHQLIEHDGAPVLLIGISDPRAHSEDEVAPEGRAALLAKLLRTAPPSALRILLAHRPRDAYAAAEHAVDVQLSGHLHGGQFFPITLLLRWLEPFVEGLCRVRDLWLYVNRGAGYWGPPNRLGARQEIAVLELTRA